MYSTQTVSLDKNHPEYETYLDFCISARDLYNQALFYCRNLFTGGNKLKNDKQLHPNEIEAINFVNDNLQNCCKKDGSLFPEITKDNYVISYYHLQKLLYKTNNESYYGIETIIVEESYTSQASILDLDSIPIYNKGSNSNYNFSGKRIKTKVYESFQHGYIHADVNGASNILRKHFPNAFDNLNLGYLQQTPIGVYGKSYC